MNAPPPREGDAADPATAQLRRLLHPTHYERLGVAAHAGPAEVEAAWQRRPADAPAGEAAARRLAYEVLRDADRRAVYDAWLRREAAALAARQRAARWWRRPAARRIAALAVVAVAVLAALAWLLIGPTLGY